jgi:excisionase family DNA binding protein
MRRSDTDTQDLTLDDLRRMPSISVEQAAKVLGIGRNSAYIAARRGEIPTVRFGARLRVPTPRLLQLLEDG